MGDVCVCVGGLAELGCMTEEYVSGMEMLSAVVPASSQGAHSQCFIFFLTYECVQYVRWFLLGKFSIPI